MDRLFLILDGEYSSLDADSAILTLYLGIYNNSLLVDELDLKLIPNNRRIICDPSSLEVNGLDLRGWDGITYKEARPLIDKFIRKQVYDDSDLKNPVKIGRRLKLIGQGVSGDIRKIQSELITKARWEESVSPIIIDTLVLADTLREIGLLDLPSISLESLAIHFEFSTKKLHNAKADALLAYLVYEKLIGLINEKY